VKDGRFVLFQKKEVQSFPRNVLGYALIGTHLLYNWSTVVRGRHICGWSQKIHLFLWKDLPYFRQMIYIKILTYFER
jgi:hypothetical protein